MREPSCVVATTPQCCRNNIATSQHPREVFDAPHPDGGGPFLVAVGESWRRNEGPAGAYWGNLTIRLVFLDQTVPLSSSKFSANMLFDDALVNISNFFTISLICRRKPSEEYKDHGHFACCLLVSKAAREKLNYAFAGAVLHSPPSYCACWQQPGLT